MRQGYYLGIDHGRIFSYRAAEVTGRLELVRRTPDQSGSDENSTAVAILARPERTKALAAEVTRGR